MMDTPKARCVICGMIWNISTYQRIPSGGYTCPHCDGRFRPAKNKEENKNA